MVCSEMRQSLTHQYGAHDARAHYCGAFYMMRIMMVISRPTVWVEITSWP